MVNMLLVAIGATFGVLGRVISSNWMKFKNEHPFPLSTFFVNMLGSLLLGVITVVVLSESFSLLIGTGHLAPFTTFSTLNVQNTELITRKKHVILVVYLGGSYFFGTVLLMVGIYLGTFL